jgi:aminoglycoside phosphotransferase (APT) family kinase protein
VHAVLDWDLAAIGPPEMDLGWYFGLEFMMDRLFGQRVPGFPERAEAVDTYQQRSGHTVSNLAWHEVFALVRALAINDRHQRIAATTGGLRSDRRTENPMIEILSARIDAAG